MPARSPAHKNRPGDGPADAEVVRRVRAGETALFELLMRRHNARVFRAVRSILRDPAEVEDVMQQAYVSAYVNLGQFAGDARFSTWLIRIAVNEALARMRRRRRLVLLEGESLPDGRRPMTAPRIDDPEGAAAGREIAALIERAIDRLPALYRSVFVLRAVDGLSTTDTADALRTSPDVVKTRLHRARAILHRHLEAVARGALGGVFAFHATRCDRVVAAVMARIAGR